MTHVVVVGAGIAGLSAAYDLAQAGVEVTVVERSDRAGGKLRTTALAAADGLAVEEGADAFLVRLPDAAALATEVGLDLVHPGTGPAQVYAAGRLRTLPPGTVLGVPGSLRGLGDVLTPGGRARAALDVIAPRTPAGEDPAVGELVRRRLGREVLDRMVDPLLGGVYAGSATGLSVRATAPALADPERSLLRTVAARRPVPRSGPVFGSVRGGTQTLATALVTAIGRHGGDVRTGCTATGLARAGAGWTVRTGPAGREDELHADAVVLAVPAPPAARLLAGHVAGPVAPATAYASVAIVTLVYPAGTALPPGNGFLVAAGERRTVKAVTFVGQKWAHPAGAPVVIRASVGRFGDERDLQRPDVELAGVAAAEVAALAGVRGRPVGSRISRWGGALPQYAPGHLGRVAALRATLPRGLAVCGAAYDGVGIPVCVRSGRGAARDILAGLGAAGGARPGPSGG